jgi:hypothetical protein
LLYQVERVAWSAALQEEQMLPEDLRLVSRADWQKHEVQDEASPDSQEVCAPVRVVQDKPHCGNVLEADVGRMLSAARAEIMRAIRAKRTERRGVNMMF